MSLTIEDRYKLLYDEHKFASEFRLKLIISWFASYAALGVAFAWIQEHSKPSSWIITTITIVITIAMWLADYRHRTAIGSLKQAGQSIEKSENIPEDQRFFSGLNKGVRHGTLIDVLSVIILLALIFATCYLICAHGELPK